MLEKQKRQINLNKNTVKKAISENYALLSILIGVFLVSLSIGPFENGDTTWEYQATSGVLKWGLPYVNNFGNLMNQPPVGFYIQAFFFEIFGSSMNTGIIVVTLFGLGCTTLVYLIGKTVYNKTIGLIAAVLFAFTPWELVLSRSFLIDVQYLFFSLLCLFVGILAVQRRSFKIFMVSGVLFATALLTKFFAVFILIPLLAFYAFHVHKSRLPLWWIPTFFIPAFLSFYLWYEVVSGQGLLSIFSHGDLTNFNPSQISPVFLFVFNFLVNYGLGWFLIDAAVLSLLVYLLAKNRIKSFLAFDIICLLTVVIVASINTFLGAFLNLKSPYLNAIKYDYLALPFFSLLAASLVTKSMIVLNSSTKMKKFSLFVGVIGLCLVGVTILYSIYYINMFSTWDYLIFRVAPNINLGYSLFNPAPQHLIFIQYLGFAFALSGLIWMSRHKLIILLKHF